MRWVAYADSQVSRIFKVLAHCAPHQPPRGRAAALGGPAAFNQIRWAPPGRAVRRGSAVRVFSHLQLRLRWVAMRVSCSPPNYSPQRPSRGRATDLGGTAASPQARRPLLGWGVWRAGMMFTFFLFAVTLRLRYRLVADADFMFFANYFPHRPSRGCTAVLGGPAECFQMRRAPLGREVRRGRLLFAFCSLSRLGP